MARRANRSSARQATPAPANANIKQKHSNPAQFGQQHHSPMVQQPAVPPMVAGSGSGLGGMFTQFATTAAGVAVGNAIGRSIVGAFSGSGESSAPPIPQQQQLQQQTPYDDNKDSFGRACESDSKALMECMNANGSDISACQFYFDMLKQCKSRSALSF